MAAIASTPLPAGALLPTRHAAMRNANRIRGHGRSHGARRAP